MIETWQVMVAVCGALAFFAGLSVLRVLAIYRQREIDAHDVARRARELYENHVNSKNQPVEEPDDEEVLVV